MFNSIYESSFSNYAFIICITVALISGVMFTILCSIKSNSSKSFYITSSLLPMAVAMTISLVNGNIGVGVAIAGAFSLVRFRSAQGTAKEICIIFISMASGLAFGMGYIGYGVLFLLIASLSIIILEKLNVFKINISEKILSITIPENLDYNNVFSDAFDKYLKKYELIKVKTTNMGSMFKLRYKIVLRNSLDEKSFIDDIRVRNGNLEVSIEKEDFNTDL